MRKSKEEHQAKLDCIVKTLFLRRDSDYLPMILKALSIRKVLDLVSLSVIDLENLSCTSPSKEILKLDPCEIGLVIFFRDFIKDEKLGLRGDCSSITFEEFNKFWSK